MGTPMSKKSIVASFSALASDTSPALEVKSDIARFSAVLSPRVGAGVIGATQRSLTDIRVERDRLAAMLEEGGVTSVDPESVDPSPFPDRLPDDDDQSFEAFKQLFAMEGQKVPVQLRPHPDQVGRYQIVYGHRRWRAAKSLGIALKACITRLSDAELVVAQGIENAVRQDLSWIEKALFAWRMEQAGVRARDIRAALAVDDPELARFRAVCRSVGEPVISAIGRAPGIGRPRWVSFSTLLDGNETKRALVLKTLAAAKGVSSDIRYGQAVAALDHAPVDEQRCLPLVAPDGSALGKAEFAKGVIRLKMSKAHAQAFASFMERELPGLLLKFGKGLEP
jgi:ParB family transcriptional regulator, chromosome partitioning protein